MTKRDIILSQLAQVQTLLTSCVDQVTNGDSVPKVWNTAVNDLRVSAQKAADTLNHSVDLNAPA
jgi:hypothetical protein